MYAQCGLRRAQRIIINNYGVAEGQIKVAGLEINDAQATLLLLNGSKGSLKVQKIAQKKLASGIIEKGVLKNPEAFGRILVELKKEARFSSPYLIVALPESLVYINSHIFPNLDRDQLVQAIELNFSEYIPGNAEDIYWGWQEAADLGGGKNKKVIFASARKDFLKNYLKSFALADLIPIAIEPSSLAAVRALTAPQEVAMILIEEKTAMAVILSDQAVKFSTSFSWESGNQDDLAKKVTQVLNFYKSIKKNDTTEVLLGGQAVSKTLAQEMANRSGATIKLVASELIVKDERVTSPVALGAAIRGMADQKDDTNLSLLPVGAQQAYEEKRVLRFFGALINLTAITSILFSIIFYGFWAFLVYLQDTTAGQLAGLAKSKSDSQSQDIQKKIDQINPLMVSLQQLIKAETAWSPVLAAINSAVSEGISLTNLSMPKVSEPVIISGNAQSRESLAKFKDNLSQNKIFETVDLTSTNLVEGQNINFIINLKYKSAATTK